MRNSIPRFFRMSLIILVQAAFLTLTGSSACAKPDFKTEDADLPGNYEELMKSPIKDIVSALYPEGNVFIGVANHAKLIGKLSTEIADREFNYITPSNDFKQSYIHPVFDEWRWDKPDAYAAYAQECGQSLRMHSPISPQCSPWVKEDNRTADELSRMLEEYMTALCLRYGGKKNILWMDVVNETICPEAVKGGDGFEDKQPGDWFSPREGSDKWENPWPIIGYDENSDLKTPLYIGRAFEIANKYAPEIKKIINQHGQFEEIVWEKMKRLVSYLRNDRGQRVDGLGWQAHIDAGWEKIPGNLERLDAIVKWCHANSLEFHVTEMNVWLKDKDNQDEEAQADTFAAVLKVLLQNRKTGVVGLNFWNVRDDDSGKAEWSGTIWKNDGKPREAYKRIKKVLIEGAD